MARLQEEYERLRLSDFKLEFRYPTDDERQRLRVIHRDMTKKQRRALAGKDKDLIGLVRALESGSIHKEDLDEQARTRLRELLWENE